MGGRANHEEEQTVNQNENQIQVAELDDSMLDVVTGGATDVNVIGCKENNVAGCACNMVEGCGGIT